jgi:hypothetical protein
MNLTEKVFFYSTLLFTGLILDVGIISTYRSMELTRLSKPSTELIRQQYEALKNNQLESLAKH